ncbi:hypothetical protein NBRC116493_02630 [Aurantivibrio infirmus]
MPLSKALGIQGDRGIKWEIYKQLEVPCADISYQWISGKNGFLEITMHFSRVIGGFKNDVCLTFDNPIAVQWEDESYGIIELPNNLPKCQNEAFSPWVYPTLIIPNSNWANTYAARICTAEEYENHNVSHFAFISMNDLLHVLSNKKPSAKIVEAKNA